MAPPDKTEKNIRNGLMFLSALLALLPRADFIIGAVPQMTQTFCFAKLNP
jgi:hypothetical protein